MIFRTLAIGTGIAAIAMAAGSAFSTEIPPASPDVLYGSLFRDVQEAHVFADQKTFADCEPRERPAEILAAYAAERSRGQVDLARFVAAHFRVPANAPVHLPAAASIEDHLRGLWDVLSRRPEPAAPGSSLLALPFPYVVPGGRFHEVYYWDSYFTMLGLRASGREDLIRAMIKNFAFELASYGLIPNGNRTYYLSRSQPPFFASMVELSAARDGRSAYLANRPALEAEYAYWTDRAAATRHVVRMPDGSVLGRYYDQLDTPRPEGYSTDEAASAGSKERAAVFFRNVRSSAESGWDFSSRWFGDGRHLATIDTLDIVPVDLNCLLLQLERTLESSRAAAGDSGGALGMRRAAESRAAAMLRACWSEAEGYFFDYDLSRRQRTSAWTLAGVAPLFFKVATRQQADRVASAISARFLRPGGVVTTLTATGQQWDAPNGWAPLEWMTIEGLRSYGHEALAREIARRWITLNCQVYARTGRMMEKYNVEDLSIPGGGGEYPTQDGFGWTNGVLLKLLQLYPDLRPSTAESGRDKSGR